MENEHDCKGVAQLRLDLERTNRMLAELREDHKALDKAHGLVANDVAEVQSDVESKPDRSEIQADTYDTDVLDELYRELVATLAKHGIDLDVRPLRGALKAGRRWRQ